MTKRFAFIFWLALTAGFAGLAQADDTVLTVCNHNTDRAIYSNYLFGAGGGSGWQSHGWYKVSAGQCFDLNFGTYVGTIYLNAQDEFQETSWGDAGVKYCVNKTDAFVINNADTIDCTDPKLKLVNSTQMTLQAGKNTWDVTPNFAQLNLCNQNTGFSVFAAFAHPVGTDVVSQGWYEVAAGKCRSVTVGGFTGRLSYYAEYNGGQLSWDGTPSQFCVNKTSAFNLPKADLASSCTDPAFKMVKAREVDIQVGMNTVNFEAQNATTRLDLCNKTPNAIQSSYAVTGANHLWQSSGWVQIAPQACASVDLGSYAGDVYVYAEYNQGQTYWGTTAFNFCVNRTANFTLPDSTNQLQCNSSTSFKMVPSLKATVTSGTNTFNFNP